MQKEDVPYFTEIKKYQNSRRNSASKHLFEMASILKFKKIEYVSICFCGIMNIIK